MSFRLLFWLLMLFWLIFECWAGYPYQHLSPWMGGTLLQFVLFGLLGWRAFGKPLTP
jgi:hypothetical protein